MAALGSRSIGHLPLQRARLARALLCSGAFALTGLGILKPAGATVIYSDLDPQGHYQDGTGFIVGGDSLLNYSRATEFTNTVGADASLGQIDLGLAVSGNASNSAVVSLWSVNASSLGTELGLWNVSVRSDGTMADALTSVTNISGITLKAGSSYFLQVSPGSPDSLIWNLNDIGATALTISTSPTAPSLSSNELAPAFQLQGKVVVTPLPASVWLMLSGLASLALLGRKSQPHKPALISNLKCICSTPGLTSPLFGIRTHSR
jgi:hypothetical protein